MKASNVSFGNVIFTNNIPSVKLTKKQREIQDLIQDKFEDRNEQNGLDSYFFPMSIEDAVSSKMKADIFITQQKNGTIEIKLKERDDFACAGKFIKDKDNKPLIIQAGKQVSKIAKQVDSYISKLRKLLPKYAVITDKFNNSHIEDMEDFMIFKNNPNDTNTDIDEMLEDMNQ